MWGALFLAGVGLVDLVDPARPEPPARASEPPAAGTASLDGIHDTGVMTCTCVPAGETAPGGQALVPLSCACVPAQRSRPTPAEGAGHRSLPASFTLSGNPSSPPHTDPETRPDGPLLSAKGRLLGKIESDQSKDFGRDYGIQQARLGLDFRSGPIRAEVEGDLAESRVLNDAWLEYRAKGWGTGRLGRFKKPFSEFLLGSAWERSALRRTGLPKAVRDLGFGSRDVGAQFGYQAKQAGRLVIEAGVFEGSAIGAAAAAEDGYARVTAAPWKPLRLGVSAGRRAVFQGGAGDALGFDARLHLGGFITRAEGLIAENGTTGGKVDGAITAVSYRFPSGAGWFEPAIEAELARHDGRDPRATIAATIGAGLGERFLLRAGVERGPTDPTGPATTALLFQAGVQL